MVREIRFCEPPPLAAARRSQGRSLRATAKEANLDPSHLLRAERGERQLSVKALYRLAQVLGLADLAEVLRPYVRRSEERS